MPMWIIDIYGNLMKKNHAKNKAWAYLMECTVEDEKLLTFHWIACTGIFHREKANFNTFLHGLKNDYVLIHLSCAFILRKFKQDTWLTTIQSAITQIWWWMFQGKSDRGHDIPRLSRSIMIIMSQVSWSNSGRCVPSGYDRKSVKAAIHIVNIMRWTAFLSMFILRILIQISLNSSRHLGA